ncbi:MAG: ABC transporter permease subunit [Acidimicrobiia bacterium]
MTAPLVAERTLRDRRRSLVGWAVGLAAYVVLQSSIYPTVRDSAFQQALRNYPKELKAFFGGAASFDFTTAGGYLNVELFSLVLPALLVVFAIGVGASAFAGELQSGTLDLLLSYPVTRTRVALEKFVAMVVGVVVLALVVAAAVLVAGVVIGFDIGVVDTFVASAGAAMVAILCGGITMLVGILTGSRAAAIGATAAVFAASYLAVGMAGLVSWLEPIRYASMLWYANGSAPLMHGLPLGDFVILLAACVVVGVATVVAFRVKDLTR